MTGDFYRDLYSLELKRRQELDSSLSLPVGLLTLLGGFLSVMAKELLWQGGALQVAFVCTLALAVLSLGGSAYQLARSFWGHDFKYLATPVEFRRWQANLIAHYEQQAREGATPEEEAAEEFEARMIDRMAEATSYNAAQNDKRSEHLFWAKGLLLLTLVLTGLTAILYTLEVSRAPTAQGANHEPEARSSAPATTATGTATTATAE